MKFGSVVLTCGVLSLGFTTRGAAQVQIRVGDPARATYSQLHEALKDGTPGADSVKAILRIRQPALLWRRLGAAIKGTGDWNSGLIALTHLAELRNRAYADEIIAEGRRAFKGI